MLTQSHPVNPGLLFALVALSLSACVSVSAQTIPQASARSPITNSTPPPAVQSETNQDLAAALRVEQIRDACIQNRRLICGKILKILPDGLVVDSGYSSLTQGTWNSWLIPGTVVATHDTNVVEGRQPDAMCIGQVFVTDLPKLKGAKPAPYDYVKIEGFPAGEYTYTSVGDLQRTVRHFSAKLTTAVKWHFEHDTPPTSPPNK